MTPTSATVASWTLGMLLREKREEDGLSGAAAAKQGGVAAAYLSDVEHGKKKLSEERLDKLIDMYDFDQEEAEELRSLREQSSHRGWWAKYSALFSKELLRFFGYEHGAESLRTYDSGIVNGLFQTEDYARAIIEGGSPNVRLAEVDRRLQCRVSRQHRVTGDDPLQISAVMSEAVLRQQVGPSSVLVGQLEHLGQLIEKHPETLDVRIVPFEVFTGHPAMGGSAFHLMTFPSGKLPTVLWQETVSSAELIMDPTAVREYGLAHAEATKSALNREDSLDLIREAHVRVTQRATVRT